MSGSSDKDSTKGKIVSSNNGDNDVPGKIGVQKAKGQEAKVGSIRVSGDLLQASMRFLTASNIDAMPLVNTNFAAIIADAHRSKGKGSDGGGGNKTTTALGGRLPQCRLLESLTMKDEREYCFTVSARMDAEHPRIFTRYEYRSTSSEQEWVFYNLLEEELAELVHHSRSGAFRNDRTTS